MLVGIYSWDWSSLPSESITNGVICFGVKERTMLILLPSTISVTVIRPFIYFEELISFSVGSLFVSFHYSGTAIAEIFIQLDSF